MHKTEIWLKYLSQIEKVNCEFKCRMHNDGIRMKQPANQEKISETEVEC